MKFDLRLGNLQDDARTDHPTLMVIATITEGDSVTVGSQFSQEFSMEQLGAFLSERRSPRPENEQVSQGTEDDSDGFDGEPSPMSSAQENALNARDQQAEDENSQNAAANTGDQLEVENAPAVQEDEDDDEENEGHHVVE